ncbi:MAG: glucose-6-phosphate isomerase, partial [Haloferula sp.]
MSFDSYSSSLIRYPELGFSLDSSLLPLGPDWLGEMQPKIERAFADMETLEAGGIANPDEGRMVGHYWLRNAGLAPSDELRAQITEPLSALKEFAEKVHT